MLMLFQKPAALVLRRPEGASKDDPGGADGVADALWSILRRPFAFAKGRLRDEVHGFLKPMLDAQRPAPRWRRLCAPPP